MKKTLTIVSLLLVAILVLASCQPEKPPVDTTPTPSTTGAVVTNAPETDPATTAAPVTEPPATTDAETQAPIVLNTIYEWTFDDSSNLGWTASNATKVTGDNANLVAEVKGGDPHISTTKMPSGLLCEDIEYITIRVKNCTDSYNFQIFISTSDSPGPAEAYSYHGEYEFCDADNEEYEIIEIDTLDIPGWTGTLKSLRFDYCDGSEGLYYMDSFTLQTTKAVETVDGAETQADPRAGKSVIYKIDFTQFTAEDIELLSAASEDDGGDDGETEEESTKWQFSTGVEDAYVEDGHLVVKIAGNDPFMSSPKLDTELSCEAITAVAIRICNKTDTQLGQFFFTNPDGDYSEAGSMRLYYEKSGIDNTTWETIVLDMKDCSAWMGILDTIRIDHSESQEGICWIEYVEFYG